MHHEPRRPPERDTAKSSKKNILTFEPTRFQLGMVATIHPKRSDSWWTRAAMPFPNWHMALALLVASLAVSADAFSVPAPPGFAGSLRRPAASTRLRDVGHVRTRAGPLRIRAMADAPMGKRPDPNVRTNVTRGGVGLKGAWGLRCAYFRAVPAGRATQTVCMIAVSAGLLGHTPCPPMSPTVCACMNATWRATTA